MKAYKIEIFSPNFTYRASCQIAELEYVFDYMDIEKNKIEVPKVIAEKGDYIRIKRGNEEYCGIISDVNRKKELIEISFKPFHKIFDVNILTDISEVPTIEQTLGRWIKKYFATSGDSLQNIPGLEVVITSATVGQLVSETGINNLYDLALEAFTTFGVLCDFKIKPQKKKVILYIGTGTYRNFVIEADRPNILEKEIIIKEAKESTNKLIIYNEENYAESITYYKDIEDNITIENTNRVVPVVFECAKVKVSSTSFEEVALKKAQQTLKASKYDNLIEITVLNNDSLVRPWDRKIGQNATIISKGVAYETILTGIEIEECTKLIFGAIRLELTKQIKRRWRNEY